MKAAGAWARHLVRRILDWSRRHAACRRVEGQILADKAQMLAFVRRLGPPFHSTARGTTPSHGRSEKTVATSTRFYRDRSRSGRLVVPNDSRRPKVLLQTMATTKGIAAHAPCCRSGVLVQLEQINPDRIGHAVKMTH